MIKISNEIKLTLIRFLLVKNLDTKFIKPFEEVILITSKVRLSKKMALD